MVEHRTVYPVKEPNPAGIPARWLRFLYRVAGLQAGRIYHVTIIMPNDNEHEPQWAISDGAKVENAR